MFREGFYDSKGQPTKLQAGDQMQFYVDRQIVMFFRFAGMPAEQRLYMDSDDKFLLSSPIRPDQFGDMAELIALTNELRCSTVRQRIENTTDVLFVEFSEK